MDSDLEDSSRKFTHVSLCNVLDDDTWIFDSGASHHFCSNKELFVKFKLVTNKKLNVAVKGVSFPIEGKGEIKFCFGQRMFTFTEIMYSSQLRRSLISSPQLDKKGLFFMGGGGLLTSWGQAIFYLVHT